MTNDPFHVNSGRRAAAPPDEYWQLLDELAPGTLTRELLPDPEQMRDRFVQLTDGETRLGIVYEGERDWLDVALFHGFGGNYADWVRHVLDTEVLRSPLRWAAYCDANDHASSSAVDIWVADVKNCDLLPRNLLDELETLKVLKDSTIFNLDSLVVGAYGEQDSPSALHLAALFERLHNLPYYIWENRSLLIEAWEDTNNHLTEIIVGDPDEPNRWMIAEDNHYSAYTEFPMLGRSCLFEDDPVDSHADPKRDALLARVQEALSPEECEPNLPLHDFQHWGDQGVIRALLHNRHRLDESLRKEIESEINDSEYRLKKYLAWPEGFETPLMWSPTLMDVELPCCGVTTTHVTFEWGTRLDAPEYRIGDSIRWDFPHGNELQPVLTDYSDVKNVLVRGKPEQVCESCGQSEVLIRIEDQRIIGIDRELTDSVSYLFQAPFLEEDDFVALCKRPELERLVNWDEFTTLWMLQQAALLSPSPDQARLVACLQKYADSYGTVRRHLPTWLQFRLRDELSDLHYFRAMEFGEVRFFQPATAPPDRETPVKSLAILHVPHEGDDFVAGFHWGSLLDFPEYQIGETIRWSEYSLGAPDVEVAYVAPRYLLGADEAAPASLLDRGLIKIVNGQIVGLEPHDGDEPIGYYASDPLAYVGKTPYLIWPDEDFLR